MISNESVMSAGKVDKRDYSDKIGLASRGAISKNYLDILKDLFAEKEITKQEYRELKQKYEYNLQRYSYS